MPGIRITLSVRTGIRIELYEGVDFNQDNITSVDCNQDIMRVKWTRIT
jgi:hypothetical protein